MSHNFGLMFIELGDLENMYLAFGISFQSLTKIGHSEKRVLPVWTAVILKSGVRVGQPTSGRLPVTCATLNT